AEGLPGLDDFLIHLPDAQLGEPNAGSDTEGHRGDHARHRTGEEDDHHGDEVHEGGHRLQEVQDRANDLGDGLVARGPHTHRYPDHQGDHTGDDYQRQALHGVLPLAHAVDDEESDEAAHG